MTGTAKLPVVFFYVQHLLGIGHVFRSTRVARALARMGCETHLIWGGTPVPDLDVTGLQVKYLTAVRSRDASFGELVHKGGEQFTEEDQAVRSAELLDCFNQVQPDILVTEAFPFGRRQMRFELVPLLEATAQRANPPMIVSSIRDIMQEGRREKSVRESLDSIHRWYDLVLVHGDPALIRIEETLQGASEIEDKIRYSGLVTPDPQKSTVQSNPKYDVLVSAGGGAVGLSLMRVALQAMKYSKKYPENWCLSAGTELPESDYQSLLHDCPDGMKVVRFLPDMVQAMRSSKVSVSRSGYNTVADVLRANTASVLVPFIGGQETEQLKRAELLAEKGIITLVRPDELSPESLAKAVDSVEYRDSAKPKFNLDGANSSAQILLDEFSSRQNPS